MPVPKKSIIHSETWFPKKIKRSKHEISKAELDKQVKEYLENGGQITKQPMFPIDTTLTDEEQIFGKITFKQKSTNAGGRVRWS